MKEGAPKPREVIKGQDGVIINKVDRRDPYDDAMVSERREDGTDYVELSNNARRDANLIIADEIPGFDEMNMVEKIAKLEALMERMLDDYNNDERYAYGEINRQTQMLRVDLQYHQKINSLGYEPPVHQEEVAS